MHQSHRAGCGAARDIWTAAEKTSRRNSEDGIGRVGGARSEGTPRKRTLPHLLAVTQVKAALPDSVQITKEAKSAFSKSARERRPNLSLARARAAVYLGTINTHHGRE